MPREMPVFTVRETHGRVLRPGNRLLAHSPEAGWRSLYAAILEEAPFQATEAAIQHPSLIYHLTRPTEVTRKIEGASQETALIGPRRICVTPGTATTKWQHSGHPEILQVYLRQSIYEAAIGEMYGCDPARAEIVPRFAILDPLLEQLAIAITAALRDGTAEDGLYVDTLAQMMAVHLARRHSARSRSVLPAAAQQISGWRMRRLIEFIEAHLEGDLSLEAMAAEVKVSPLYLARAFKAAIGQSPHQYVLARRLERAKELLRGTDAPIVEVALSAGFSSQSHLSNWFVRQVGVSPALYRRQGLH
ncbi:MAG TPA: AraC family transcriptional regulator [Bryobacteraceae bacterium]|nr:AraC family transcriptional regulator [Bryobacteraceae bacterium]